MRFWWIVCLLVSVTAWGQETDLKAKWRVGVGGELRGVRSLNQENMSWLPSWGVEGGVDYGAFGFRLETRFWRDQSSSGDLSVAAQGEQALLWARWRPAVEFDWFVQGGTGLRRQHVENRLLDDRVRLTSDPEQLLGIGTGFARPLSKRLRAELVIRLLKAENESAWEPSGSASVEWIL